jgi:hypothetical protein
LKVVFEQSYHTSLAVVQTDYALQTSEHDWIRHPDNLKGVFCILALLVVAEFLKELKRAHRCQLIFSGLNLLENAD